jgi:hypothetical protein
MMKLLNEAWIEWREMKGNDSEERSRTVCHHSMRLAGKGMSCKAAVGNARGGAFSVMFVQPSWRTAWALKRRRVNSANPSTNPSAYLSA